MKCKKPMEINLANGPQIRSRTNLVRSIKNGQVKKVRHVDERQKSTNLMPQDRLQLLKGAVVSEDINLVRELLKHKPVSNNNRKFEEILWIALKNHQSEIAMMLIRAGASVKKYNVNDTSFPSVLHAAIKIGCKELIRLAIERGANVNTQDIYGDSVLHQAMYSNSSSNIVIELLKRGADIEAHNYNSVNVFQAAARNCKAADLVMILVNWGNPDVATRHSRALAVLWELVRALKGPDLFLLSELLATGVPVNQQRDEYELTIFERAIIERKFAMIVMMINLAVDIKGQLYKLDVHPLFLASRHADPIIAKLLIENGSIVHAYNGLGQTPLFAACYSGSYKNINLLLQLGADINKVDNTGHVAFSYLDHTFGNLAGRKFFIQQITLLVSQGAQVHNENLAIIRDCPLTEICYKACIRELQIMKDIVIYNKFTLHSILSMDIERLTLLMRNRVLVKNLKKRLNSKSYPLYYDVANKKVNVAKIRLVFIDKQTERLFEIFKNILPLIVIEKIAFYSYYKDLFSLVVDYL